MHRLAITSLAALAMLASLPSLAAEPVVVPLSNDRALPIADTGFDWNGFYAGVYGVTQTSSAGEAALGLGLDLGVNARFEFVLVGAEVAFQGLSGGAGAGTLQTLGRVGVTATDDLVLYAAGGLGLDLGPAGESTALFGGGVELAVTEAVSVRGQYLHGVPLATGESTDQFTIGANFHF